jgi:hypothetical protein
VLEVKLTRFAMNPSLSVLGPCARAPVRPCARERGSASIQAVAPLRPGKAAAKTFVIVAIPRKLSTTPTLCAYVAFGLTLAVASCSSCSKKSDANAEQPSTTSMLAAATGEARIVADEHGYNPSSIAVPKGPPGSKATLTFVRTTDKTCATEVVFPELHVEKPLPLNVPVSVEVPSDSARTLTFQCGMAMFKGALIVK